MIEDMNKKEKSTFYEWQLLKRDMERLEEENPNQLERRYEWARVMSDKALESEKERQVQLQNICNSSLLAQSFLMAAEAAIFSGFLQAADGTTSLMKASYWILGLTYTLQLISVFLVLLAVFYRHRDFYNSPKKDVEDFLDEKRNKFDHLYSENKGYIMVSDLIHKTLLENDNKMRSLVNASLIIIMSSLLPFIVCLILWVIQIAK